MVVSRDVSLGVDAMASGAVIAWAVVLASVILLIAVCAQGRLRHAILWMMGAVPRERPRLEATVPRSDRHWSIVGRLSDDVGVPERDSVAS